jgi:hypothetical protein
MLFFDQTFQVNKDVFNNVIRLSPKGIKDPYTVIVEFFNSYSLAEIRELLYKAQRVGLATENTEFFEPSDRSNLIFGLERLEQLAEAAYLIHQSKKPKKKKKTRKL